MIRTSLCFLLSLIIIAEAAFAPNQQHPVLSEEFNYSLQNNIGQLKDLIGKFQSLASQTTPANPPSIQVADLPEPQVAVISQPPPPRSRPTRFIIQRPPPAPTYITASDCHQNDQLKKMVSLLVNILSDIQGKMSVVRSAAVNLEYQERQLEQKWTALEFKLQTERARHEEQMRELQTARNQLSHEADMLNRQIEAFQREKADRLLK